MQARRKRIIFCLLTIVVASLSDHVHAHLQAHKYTYVHTRTYANQISSSKYWPLQALPICADYANSC